MQLSDALEIGSLVKRKDGRIARLIEQRQLDYYVHYGETRKRFPTVKTFFGVRKHDKYFNIGRLLAVFRRFTLVLTITLPFSVRS